MTSPQATQVQELDTDQPEALADLQDAHRAKQLYLTPAAQAFAEHWAINRNQIKAYQHAFPGASEGTAKAQARRLFADPRVQAEIFRVLDRWTDHSAIEISRIEKELSRLAFVDVRALYDSNGDIKPPHEWDADTAAAVHTVKTSTTTSKDGEVTVTRQVRMYDKHAAARTLAELKGGFERNKAPPGVQAAFSITFANGAQPAGVARGRQSVTIGVDTSQKAAKPAQNRAVQASGTGSARPETHGKPAKPARRAPRTIENSPARPVGGRSVGSPSVQPPPARRKLFGDAA